MSAAGERLHPLEEELRALVTFSQARALLETARACGVPLVVRRTRGGK